MSAIVKPIIRRAIWATIPALLVLAVPALGIDPDLPYSSGSTGADGALTFRTIPIGRNATAMAYDAERQEVVLFGGFNGGYLNDTWVLRGNNWVEVTPATSPIPRYGMRLAYDSVRKEVVLFGGYREGGLNDTWVWNGSSWTQKSPANAPSARWYHTMSFDSNSGKVVLYGGNAANPGGSETWTWDGTNWTKVNTAASPGNQNGQGMAYDAARQRTVMFTPSRQTWVFDGSNWANVSPAIQPPGRDNGVMTYDAARQEVVLYGGSNLDDTWVWNGSIWSQKSPTSTPDGNGRNFAGIAYHAGVQRVVLYGGQDTLGDPYSSDTFLWNGTDWTFVSGKQQTFDMSSRANGIFNFTTINIPPRITVVVKKNANNTPLRWLATGDVNVEGIVAVDGEIGRRTFPPGVVAKGGPGGFDGGAGGIPFSQSDSFSGSPGQGPGGGQPGDTLSETGSDAQFNGTSGYGNAFLQPLVGGSGGGGGGSNNNTPGGNGTGGGGALMIASSRDINITGTVRANGGGREHSGASWGGLGSGGAILLRADRITGNGRIEAFGGEQGNQNGRIRLEAFFRLHTGPQLPAAVGSAPIAGADLTQQPSLAVTRVAGVNVVPPPTGNQLTPDVVFSQAGQITVTVAASNVPDGTAVRLRVTTSTGVVDAGPQFLAGGTASFNLIVPAGTGTIQAFADFRTSN